MVVEGSLGRQLFVTNGAINTKVSDARSFARIHQAQALVIQENELRTSGHSLSNKMQMINKRVLSRQTLQTASGIEASKLDSRLSTRIRQTQSFAVEQYKLIPARIPGLLGWQCPYAVILRIVKFIIQPLNAMLRTWTWPHIHQEAAKVLPFLINGNPATSVVLERAMAWIAYTIKHVLPRHVCKRFPTASTMPMLDVQAATGLRVAASKVTPGYCGAGSAGAQTDPRDSFPLIGIAMQDGESSKCLPSQINRTIAKLIKIGAATGFGRTFFEMSRCNYDNVSTRTLAFPPRFALRGVFSSTHNNQSMKLLASKVRWLHGMALCISLLHIQFNYCEQKTGGVPWLS